jgi:Ni,Fe-hydrogenase I small subunit
MCFAFSSLPLKSSLCPNNCNRARFELITLVVIGTDCIGSCKSNYHDHEGTLRTTELNIVELDTSGNYRDRTSHNKKNFIWYTDTLMKNMLNFENELIENRK